MFLRKKIFFTFLILYEIPSFINTEEYLKELKPKDFTFNDHDELPPVELPQPIIPQKTARFFNDELTDDDELTKSRSLLLHTERPTLMDVALEASVREGLNAMRRLYLEIEPNMAKNGELLQKNHPAALLSKFSAPLLETSRREMAAYATLTATKFFRKNYDQGSDLARQAHSEKVSLRRTALESMCPPRDPPTCMPASERYRTHDGTCNNKRRPRWGAAQMPFNRFLPPEYGDGVDATRTAIDGVPLSSARFVSLLVHGAREGEAALTLMLAQWGQLLDHDMTSTAQPRSINGSVPSCCGSKNFHPSCFPIKVPLDDPWLSSLKVRCLEFLRSAPAQRRDCALSWREQTNQATSYIDGSPIYSSSVKSSDTARVFRKGLLIFGRGNPDEDVCQRGAISTHCIRSGDGRSSEQPGLLALHHVWVHEHNRLAMKLSELNLHWSDEKVYQETRRIIGAMFQHITYREFLPIVLGREVVKLFDLELLTSGYYEGYDRKTNPTVANGFAAAAFRFGHSLVQNSYMRCDRFYNVISSNVTLHEEFQRGDIGSAGSLHRLLRGMATQRALKRDEFITPELTNHLFQTPGFPFGLDLAAINIQRGRDHGIPPYIHWRVPCGLSPINSWEDFAKIVGPESARRISHAYNNVHDIDLFVGGIAERPVVGGIVGPTFACIIAQQFSNSRKGDRFWYENSGFESSFTPAQLHSIRRVSLASVLCRAVGGGTFQPLIFLPPQFPNNERLPCGQGSLVDFDIEPWLEQDPFVSLGVTHTGLHETFRPTLAPQTLPTIVKPHPLTDRIFDTLHLETELPESLDTTLSNNKVGFSNRNPAMALIKDPVTLVTKKPHMNFIPSLSNSFHNTRNSSKISDKLDLKKKSTSGHVTKQKPIPGVNNKLDKNNRKGGNRLGAVQSTTRRTIIINNIPIELRNAGRNKEKKTISSGIKNELEPRTGNTDIVSDTEVTEKNGTKTTAELLSYQIKKEDVEKQLKEKTNHLKTRTVSKNIESENNEDSTAKQVKRKTETIFETEVDSINSNTSADSLTHTQTKTDILTTHQLKTAIGNKLLVNNGKNISTALENQTKLTVDNYNEQKGCNTSTDTEIFSIKKTKQTNSKNLQDSELKNLTLYIHSAKEPNDSDIDPMIQTNPSDHKRVRRKLKLSDITVQLKDKLQLVLARNETIRNNTHILVQHNRTLTTKSPKPSRTTTQTAELRQYQNRPLFTKAPQKVVVDSVNGDNQYEIEINIRQSNKSPKPVQSTPYVAEYTSGYKPSQFDRYTTNYQTTPFYAYYQPVPTRISTLTQNQKTKPPTIIFVNEHDQQTTTKLPGFLQSIAGWNYGTKRPLPASIGFNERPSIETVIGSPHSTVNMQPNYQKPPAELASLDNPSSFSQTQVGLVQTSSGNFGSIAGFASAHGADSTFSFNIRPKPDTTHINRPITNGGNYGLQLPHRNPWFEQSPTTAGQHFATYEPPYRETVNSPFSTSNLQKYFERNKSGAQRKEVLTLTPAHELIDYDYAGRTLHHLSNRTTDEETLDHEDDYEYDDDYGTSPLLRSFNQDGYLRPEHMRAENLNLTADNNQTLDDNYVLPVLNKTQNSTLDLPKPISTNFSNDFPDALAKHLSIDIFAEEDDKTNFTQNKERDGETISRVKAHVLRELQSKRNKNRNRNNVRNHEKIAFAPINILTRPERPDNWVFFDSPHQQESSLPQIPEINMDPFPSAEIPKPFKQNIWLDLSKIKRKLALSFKGPLEHLIQQTDTNAEPTPDNSLVKDRTLKRSDIKSTDTLKDSMSSGTLTESNKQTSDLTDRLVTNSDTQRLI